MKLPALALALAVALTACGGSHASAPATSQVASATGVTTSSTTAAPTTSSSGRTASSTTSAPPTTTALDVVDPATPTTSMLDHAPSTLPGAMTIPVVSSAEDEAIFAGYRAFESTINSVASHPHAPDWAALRASTMPDTFELMRADLERRFRSGEIASVAGGYELHPVILQRYSVDFVGLTDCIVDRTYWMYEATSQPVDGENVGQHLTAMSIDMIKRDGTWVVSGTIIGNHPCGS